MKRHIFTVKNISANQLKDRLLQQCALHEYSSFLDSNGHKDAYHRFEWIAALGAREVFKPASEAFDELRLFHQKQQDWLFGHLGYDLKNQLEQLSTHHPDTIGFADMLFFVPETVAYTRNGTITVESLLHSSESDFLKSINTEDPPHSHHSVQLEPLTSRSQYLEKLSSLKDHLQYGNIYEINYCIEFAGESRNFSPLEAFRKLNDSARAPFSAFYKNEGNHLLCSSPERYLHKTGDTIISQPIKGTIKRSKDPAEDELLKTQLRDSEKERSENVMITDLVRNDLSKTAARASVKVKELFGVYTFNTVHQMISTVESKLAAGYHFADVLKTTFPMGSMTGAPKPKAMELIEEHENFARNLYSGAVGYITPASDFDFNVVIRSIFYNAATAYISARVGSAITIHCDAEQEYEECLLKAENLFRCLQ